MTLAPEPIEHERLFGPEPERPVPQAPVSVLPPGVRRKPTSPLRAMAVVAAFLLPMSEGLAPGPQRLWGALFIATLAGMALSRRARPSRYGTLWVMATLAALGATALTLPNSLDVAAHRNAAIALVVVWSLAPPVFTWLLRSTWARPCGLAVICGQTLSALVALYVSVTGRSILGSEIGIGRADGLAGHVNILGLMSAVVCVWTIDSVLARRGTRFSVSVGVVNFAALVLSGSLSALSALLCGAFICAVARRVRPTTVVKVGFAAFALLLAGSHLAASAGLQTPIDRLRQTAGQTEQVSTLDERWRTWQFGLRTIESRPWSGVGLDDRSGSTDVRGIVVHNFLIRAWMHGGPFLGVAALAIFVSTVRLVISAARQGGSGVASSTLATLGSFSLTSAALQQPYFWLLFIGAWCAIANGLPSTVRAAPRASRRPVPNA